MQTGDAEEPARRISALLAQEPGNVRLVDDAAGVSAGAEAVGTASRAATPADRAGIGTAPSSADYREVASGLFARHPKHRPWFGNAKKDELVGFGVGSFSRYAGMSFTTTRDMGLYVEQAGRSSAIYESVSMESR